MKNNNFIENLNKEIDRKIQMIDDGKMEPVTRLKASDYILSVVIIIASLLTMIWAYFAVC